MRKYLARRKEVLELLYKYREKYISGAEMSKKLDVSRTTIWKYIKYFREAGYQIDSSSRLGYKLLTTPDILLPEEIKRNLSTDLIGTNILHYDKVASTNEVIKEKAESNINSGTIIVAEEQTGGKGRLGRNFYSPPGGIWISVFLTPDIKPALATRATYLFSLAVAETINQTLDLSAKIKWPNDLLINEKKVAGILTEMGAEIDQINYLVGGMGINANFMLAEVPDDLRTKLTTFMYELETKINRIAFIQTLLYKLEALYPLLFKFDQLIHRWKQYSLTLGKKVEVIDGEKSYFGQAVEIATDGALILKLGKERKKVYSGEVSLAYN